MELVSCPEHGNTEAGEEKHPGLCVTSPPSIFLCVLIPGSSCLLKTGVRPGLNQGKSFYLCGVRTCSFFRATE